MDDYTATTSSTQGHQHHRRKPGRLARSRDMTIVLTVSVCFLQTGDLSFLPSPRLKCRPRQDFSRWHSLLSILLSFYHKRTVCKSSWVPLPPCSGSVCTQPPPSWHHRILELIRPLKIRLSDSFISISGGWTQGGYDTCLEPCSSDAKMRAPRFPSLGPLSQWDIRILSWESYKDLSIE